MSERPIPLVRAGIPRQLVNVHGVINYFDGGRSLSLTWSGYDELWVGVHLL